MKHKDLTIGTDGRGDKALFIDERHFKDENTLKMNVSKKYGGPEGLVYFRVIAKGEEQRGHGVAIGKDVVQWG